MNIKLKSKEEIFEALEEAERVGCESWRWGTTETYVFQREGKHYRFTIQCHASEGLQDEYVTATEVKPVQKTVTIWEPVQQ